MGCRACHSLNGRLFCACATSVYERLAPLHHIPRNPCRLDYALRVLNTGARSPPARPSTPKERDTGARSPPARPSTPAQRVAQCLPWIEERARHGRAMPKTPRPVDTSFFIGLKKSVKHAKADAKRPVERTGYVFCTRCVIYRGKDCENRNP